MRVGRFINRLSRELAYRRRFLGLRSWLLFLYDRLLRRWRRLPLPLWEKPASVRLAALDQPLMVRLGSTDLLVVQEVFLDGEYEPLLRAAPAEVRSVVDLGANIGVTVRLWQQTWPAATIIAVEPDIGNLSVCRRNVALGGGAQRVMLLHTCAAGRSRSVRLDRSQGQWSYRISEQADDRGPEVSAMTIPQILTWANLSGPVDVLKCDIEGAEAEVFADCATWIGRVRYLVVELHRPYTSQQFLLDLSRSGQAFEVFDQEAANDVTVLFLRNPRCGSGAGRREHSV